MPVVVGHIGPINIKDLRIPGITRCVQDPSDWRVQRMTEQQLARFVVDIVDGKIMLAQHVQPFTDVDCVFPAISFLLEISPDARREIGTFYEYRRLSCATARNGQPSFQTVQFVHREDWSRARDMIAAEVLRRERLTP